MRTQNVLIRDEKASDFATITEVTVAAFETMEISRIEQMRLLLQSLQRKDCAKKHHAAHTGRHQNTIYMSKFAA
jgi:hypothetical protein